MIVRRLILAALCVVAGASVFSGAPAVAAFSLHPFKGSFGTGGLGVFEGVQSIAVDQSTGDVYVYETGGGGSIYRFNAAGEPAPFVKLGKNVIVGVGAAPYNNTDQVAVDGSSGPGKGDVYVASYGSGRVAVYASQGAKEGELIGELNGAVETEVPGATWGEPFGVAVSPAGDVYVGLLGTGTGTVNRYAPAGSPVVNKDYTSALWGVGEVCNVAVDAEESVYVDGLQESFGGRPVTKFGAAQFNTTREPAQGTQLAGEGGSTLAVDASPSAHTVYVDEESDFAQYSFAALPELVARFGLSGASGSHGIAVNATTGNSASGDIYVSNGAGLVDVLGPSRAEAPSVLASVSDVTSSGATLRAQINPSLADTTYHFEYGLAAGSYSTSLPGGDVGSGFSDVSVQAPRLRGLQPGTAYHYRVVASNSLGSTVGPDEVFTTQSVGGSFVLPDGRVYEMVSPLDKNGADIGGGDKVAHQGVYSFTQAAVGGGSVAFSSTGSFASPLGNPYGGEYVSVRGSGGWSTENVSPPLKTG